MKQPTSSKRPRLWPVAVVVLLIASLMCGACLLLVIAIFPQFTPQKNLILYIDGQPQPLVTGADTVADLLQELDIVINEGDTVSPALTDNLAPDSVVRVQSARSVTVTIDGQSQVYRTSLENPAQILQSMGIMVGRSDEVMVDGTRIAAAQLAQWPIPALEIDLRRTLTLQLIDDGHVQTIETTSQTVGEALFDAGITLYLADEVMPPINSTVTSDTVITITRAQPLYIIADGTIVETRTQGKTVNDALTEAGVMLVGQDYSLPDIDTPLLPGMRIRVIRVTEEIITEETTQPYETVYQPDAMLEIDHQQVAQSGQQGIVRTDIRIVYENGVEVLREPIASVVVQEARNHIISYGTNIVLRTVDTPDGPRQYWRRIRMWATSYHPAALGGDNITAIGATLQKGIIASRPDLIAYRSEVFVPGYGVGTMADTGPIYRPLFIDLGYSDDDYQPWARWVDVYLLAPPPEGDIMYILPG